MTRTITSNAPGSGTSISSSLKASFGSPWVSSRITQAAMVSGSVPGSTSSSLTFVMSTAMRGRLLRAGALAPLRGRQRDPDIRDPDGEGAVRRPQERLVLPEQLELGAGGPGGTPSVSAGLGGEKPALVVAEAGRAPAGEA